MILSKLNARLPVNKPQAESPSTALVHDWLVAMRGGERCLEVFSELLPDAPILTLLHEKGAVGGPLEKRQIIPSALSKWRLTRKNYRRLLPVFPWAVNTLPGRDYDVLVSLSHCAAKAVPTRPEARHIRDCFTPARYLWDQREEYFTRERASLFVRAGAKACLPYLRRWDIESARRVDRFIAISDYVAERIQRTYGRESDVVYPPVDVSRFRIAPAEEIGDHYLIVSALAPYKGIDLAVRAFLKSGKKLRVIGRGEEERLLRSLRAPNIEFRGWLPDEAVADKLARCRAVVLPCAEDFGIVPLEGMASGRPVIALGVGGALETVVAPGTAASRSGAAPTGVFFEEAHADALNAAIEDFERDLDHFDPHAARRRALEFDRPIFKARIASILAEEGLPVEMPVAPIRPVARGPFVAAEKHR